VLKPARGNRAQRPGPGNHQSGHHRPKTIPLEPKADAEAQTVSFALPETLAPGKYSLSIEFTGHLREQAQGLFFVRYSAGAGKKLMLATQMEATDARRMFPCWDEPFSARALSRRHRSEKAPDGLQHAIKNEKSLNGGLKEVHFEATPPMASYLVVLVSGELEALEDSSKGVRYASRNDRSKKETGRYALESAKKILGYYNHYFGIEFPLPKLDQIAIPGGFCGAMENWAGLLTTSRSCCFDPRPVRWKPNKMFLA